MMKHYFPFAIFGLFLTACTPQPLVAPIEQIEQAQQEQATQTTKVETPLTQSSVKNRTVLYQCAKKQTVKITKAANSKKTQNITVEFKQVSHRLSSAVTRKNSRKYSNIRWIWTEDFNGKGVLTNKNGKILAENCVKK